MVLVNPFLRFTKTTDFFLLKSPVLRARVLKRLLTSFMTLEEECRKVSFFVAFFVSRNLRDRVQVGRGRQGSSRSLQAYNIPVSPYSKVCGHLAVLSHCFRRVPQTATAGKLRCMHAKWCRGACCAAPSQLLRPAQMEAIRFETARSAP